MSDDANVKTGGNSRLTSNLFLVSVLIAAAAGLRNLPIGEDGSQGSVTADWTSYGRDEGGSRFSPADQINQQNVRNLEVAWIYRTGDFPNGQVDFRTTTAFEATPILVDGLL